MSRYFHKILDAVSSGLFYQKYVYLPNASDPVDLFITGQAWFYPFFEGALGAMDGTHINCAPSASECQAAHNQKGGVSQNTLACVSFLMRFQYMVSGCEGSAADVAMYTNSRYTDLHIPEGKYYLADTGFGICDALLVLYHGVCYHLAEWGHANQRFFPLDSCSPVLLTINHRPENAKELYNLCHASVQNVVERVFGILKKKWGILTCPPQFLMSIQARVPPAMCALHNFILAHNPDDVDNYLTGNENNDADPNPGQMRDNNFGMLANTAVSPEEKACAEAKRDRIAEEMWNNYQRVLREHE